MKETAPQKLGRIIRLQRRVKMSPQAMRGTAIVVHSVLAMVMLVMLFYWRWLPESDMLPAIVMMSIYWLLACVGLLQGSWARSFELQLLPGAVQITKWGRTTLLIEPEVIGGRVGNVICLRSGEITASIPVYALPQMHDRAAVVEHCSQFLSPEQQALYGSDWAKQYCRLITPRKPADPLHTLVVVAICFAIGGAVLVGCYEYIAWRFPGEIRQPAFRIAYVGWFGFAAMFTGLPAAALWRKRRVVVAAI
jgi:hypothetical protein